MRAVAKGIKHILGPLPRTLWDRFYALFYSQKRSLLPSLQVCVFSVPLARHKEDLTRASTEAESEIKKTARRSSLFAPRFLFAKPPFTSS